MRQLNAASLDLIREFEGLRLEAYLCPAGVLTIGYGHTSYAGSPEVTEGMKVTEGEANAILERDMAKFCVGVLTILKHRPTDNQLGAFASLCMNIGLGAFKKSTAVKRFNTGDTDGAADAITMWNKATVNGKKVKLHGLVRRREAERALFLTPQEPDDDCADPVEAKPAGPVTGGEGKHLAKSKTTIAGGSLVAGLGAYSQIKDAMPEVAVYAPYILAAIAAYIVFNRFMESRAGEH